MAKINVVKNVFNPDKEMTQYTLDDCITVRDFIEKERINSQVYASEYECYDPETDDVSTMLFDDDADSPLNVSIMVNGEAKDLDYIIQEYDEVAICILPASSSFGPLSTVFNFAGTIAMAFGGAGLFIGAVCLMIGAALGLAAMSTESNKKNTKPDDEAEASPTLVGSSNQAIGSNPFPAVLGTTEITPYVIGSPYNDFIDDGTKKAKYGTKQKQTLLLGLGYAPLHVDEIKIDNMPLSTNPNKVISGVLSHETGDGAVDKIFGQQAEIAAMYKNNKFKLELNQLGLTKNTIYPYTVKQKNLDVALMYVYDKKVEEVATEHNLYWQGATFPTGLRTNSVYFSEAVPYKIAVGITFPKGLYKEYTDKDGNFVYDKIPLNLVVQWRPLYKYTEDMDVKNGRTDIDEASNVYTYDDDIEKKYSLKRYGAWRNFDDNVIVPKIRYTTGAEVRHTDYYDENGKPYVDENNDLYYLYWSSFSPEKKEKKTYGKYYSNKKKFISNLHDIYLSAYKTKYKLVDDNSLRYVSYQKVYAAGDGVYDPKDGSYVSLTEASSVAWQRANADADKYFDNQALAYGHAENEEEIIENSGNTVVSREVNLNYGLSEEGKWDDCNNNWNGVECFSFGEFSCGPNAVSGDPSVDDKIDSMKNIEDAKDSMSFELTATLKQEDILDLLNENPFTNTTGAFLTDGGSNVVTDCIQIRVVRLTPCYIDKLKKQDNTQVQHTYSDVVKWNYIKTYCIDKTKLQNDIERSVPGDPVGRTYINCSTKGDAAEGGYNYKNWDISKYYSTPLNDNDRKKLVTLAVECEPDKLGYIKDSLKKISVKAHAIAPSLRQEYVRLWKQVDGDYYYHDCYANEDNISGQDVPENDFEWIYSNRSPRDVRKFDYTVITKKNLSINDLLHISKYVEPRSVDMEVRDKEWQSAFFPKAIHQKTSILPRMNASNGIPEKNDNGDIIYDDVVQGNDWLEYITNIMSRKSIYSHGLMRYVATNAFLEAFADQNAIAQVLGFSCGPALGREAKVYNSLNSEQTVRFWFIKDGHKYYYDSEYTEKKWNMYYPELPSDTKLGMWTEATDEYFKTFQMEGTVNGDVKWCYINSRSSFNMLSVRESYIYTDAIDLGKGPVKWNYNLYLTQQRKFSDIFKEILVGGLAYWVYDDKHRYEIHNDKPQKNAVFMITDENCISSSNTREFKKSIGGYHVVYKDEDNGGRPGEIHVLRNDQNLTNPTKDILDLQLSGITNGRQAKAYGAYMLALQITHREVWTRKLNHVSQALSVGSLVKIQGSTLEIGTDHSGRIERLIEDENYVYGFILDGMYTYRGEFGPDGKNIQGVTLMQSATEFKSRFVTLGLANSDQETNGIKVMMGDRNVVLKNNIGETNLVLFEKKINKRTESAEVNDETISPTTYKPSVGDVVAFGNIGSITSDAIVYEMSYDKNGKATVTCYPYFDELYQCERNLPTYRTNLTKKENNGNIPINEAFVNLGLNEFSNATDIAELKKDTQTYIEEMQLKPAPRYEVSIDTPVISMDESGVCNPDSVSCRSTVTYYGSGEPVVQGNSANWKIVINEKYSLVYEDKTSIRFDIDSILNKVKEMYVLKDIIFKSLRIIATSKNSSAIVYRDEYIPVLTDGDEIKVDLENQSYSYNCYTDWEGTAYGNGYIPAEVEQVAIVHVYEGTKELEFKKHWNYAPFTAPAGLRYEINPSNGNLHVIALVGDEMVEHGSMAIPIIARSSKITEVSVGYVDDDTQNVEVGYIENGEFITFGYEKPSDSISQFTVYFEYQKLTDVARRIAESENIFRDLSDDEKITPIEKVTLKEKVDEIKMTFSEYTKRYSKYDSYKAYKEAYDALIDYLEEEGIFKNMSKTSDIIKEEFNKVFDDFSDALSNIGKEIASTPSYLGKIEDGVLPQNPRIGDKILWASDNKDSYVKGCTYRRVFKNGTEQWEECFEMDESCLDVLDILEKSVDTTIPAVQWAKRLCALQIVTNNLVSKEAYIKDLLQVGGKIDDTKEIADWLTNQTALLNGVQNSANYKWKDAYDGAIREGKSEEEARRIADSAKIKYITTQNIDWDLDRARAAVGGKTIVSGGYIKTDLIDVDELNVNHLKSGSGDFESRIDKDGTANFGGLFEVDQSYGLVAHAPINFVQYQAGGISYGGSDAFFILGYFRIIGYYTSEGKNLDKRSNPEILTPPGWAMKRISDGVFAVGFPYNNYPGHIRNLYDRIGILSANAYREFESTHNLSWDNSGYVANVKPRSIMNVGFGHPHDVVEKDGYYWKLMGFTGSYGDLCDPAYAEIRLAIM